jgi:hypothetical protein
MTNDTQLDINAHGAAIRALAAQIAQTNSLVDMRQAYQAIGQHIARAEALHAPQLVEDKSEDAA